MNDYKKALTPEEIIMVAQGALTYGMPQHHLAGLYGVDSGRVAEAVVVMRWAAANHKLIYRHIQKLKGKGRRNGKEEAPLQRLLTAEDQ